MRCTRSGGSIVSPTFLAGSMMVRSNSDRSIAPSRTREALIELGRTPVGLIAIAFAGLTALAAIALAPLGATLFYLGLSAAWTAGATVAFTQALVLPLLEPFLAGLTPLAAITAYRFAVADKKERSLRSGLPARPALLAWLVGVIVFVAMVVAAEFVNTLVLKAGQVDTAVFR